MLTAKKDIEEVSRILDGHCEEWAENIIARVEYRVNRRIGIGHRDMLREEIASAVEPIVTIARRAICKRAKRTA